MKIESPEYAQSDLTTFLDEMQGHDQQVLADRLQRASQRLAEIAPRVTAARGGGDEWSAVEVLAHIAGLSKFYGVVVHRMVSGKMTDLNLLIQAAQMRDGSIDEMAGQEPGELLRMTLADHERTIKELRTADAAALRRAAPLPEGGTMTAEEVARLPLISHIEMHLDQLEKSLG
jgi:hypothetical protein